jgi:hypothetical protein
MTISPTHSGGPQQSNDSGAPWTAVKAVHNPPGVAVSRTRQEHLQDRRSRVRASRFGHEALGASPVGPPDGDRLLSLQFGHQGGQVVAPGIGPGGTGTVTHDGRDLDHIAVSHVGPARSRFFPTTARSRPDDPDSGLARTRFRAGEAMTLLPPARLIYDTQLHCAADYPRRHVMEIINLGAADGLPPVDWAAVAATLEARSAPAPDAHNSRTTWLATVNEDGSPHVTAVGALWLDGSFWFQTGDTRKGRNVGRDPRCSIRVDSRCGRRRRGRGSAGDRPRRHCAHCEGVGGWWLAGGSR